MYNYLIQNARVLDGSGAPAFPADVAVQGGVIAAVGQLGNAPAAHVIDAAGRYLTPGFIDVHRHADGAIFLPDFGCSELAQGLTTILNGNCGLSLAPVRGAYREALLQYLAPIAGGLSEGLDVSSLAAYQKQLQTVPLRLNGGILVGMGTLRACVTGFEDRDLTDG